MPAMPTMPALLTVDWWALGPMMALTVGALVLLMFEFLPEDKSGARSAIVSLVTLAVAAWAEWQVRDAKRAIFSGMFAHDTLTVFFTLLFCAIAAVSVLISWGYVERTRLHPGEYYALLLSATLGMIVMAASNDLITIFLGLELMSIALYILVGFRRNLLESNEASLKYFLLGAFASGFYSAASRWSGATGTKPARDRGVRCGLAGAHQAAVYGGRAADPHGPRPSRWQPCRSTIWAPDAYEGAPTSVTAFMAAGAKAAGFAAALRASRSWRSRACRSSGGRSSRSSPTIARR
jgi:NADH-quinone oxidoreductase subunit N